MRITKLKTKKAIVFLFFSFFGGFLILTQNIQSAQAQTSLWDKQVGVKEQIGSVYGQVENPQDIRITIAKIINVFLGLLGIIFIIMIVWAGFKWMTSGGNEDQIKEAQAQILRATIGLLIILSSWSITQFVMNCVVSANNIDVIWYCPSL